MSDLLAARIKWWREHRNGAMPWYLTGAELKGPEHPTLARLHDEARSAARHAIAWRIGGREVVGLGRGVREAQVLWWQVAPGSAEVVCVPWPEGESALETIAREEGADEAVLEWIRAERAARRTG